MVRMGPASLCNLEHRGASGAEVTTGDGACIVQIPDRFHRQVAGPHPPPEAHTCPTGIAFLPTDPAAAAALPGLDRAAGRRRGLVARGWREVPAEPSPVGSIALSAVPSYIGVPGRRHLPDRTGAGGGEPSSRAREFDTETPPPTSPPSRPAPPSTR